MTTEIDTLLDFSDERDEDYLPTAGALARMRAYLKAAPLLPTGVAGFCGAAIAEWSHGTPKAYRLRLNCHAEDAAEDYIYYSAGGSGAVEPATSDNLVLRLREFAGAGRGDADPTPEGSSQHST